MRHILIMLVAISTLADASATSDALKSLTGDLEIRSKTRTEIEYCMDNVCDLVTSSLKTTQVRDFAFLYFFYGSSREGVSDSTIEKQREYERKLVAKYMKPACKKLSHDEQARCVLKALAAQNRIKLYVVRYDEGARHVMPASLKDLKIEP